MGSDDGSATDQAYRIAAQSVLGSAKMVLELNEHPAVLKDMVCSPGGTTIEAIYTLEKNSFRGSVMEAVRNCALKADQINRRSNREKGRRPKTKGLGESHYSNQYNKRMN